MNTNFRIHLLEAKTGDAFIVDCGANRFIIDGGTAAVAKQIKRFLTTEPSQRLKSIFVTHTDRDHIGGILKLFTHNKETVATDVPILINHPSSIPIKRNTNGRVTFQDGDNLKVFLEKNGYKTHQITSDKLLKFEEIEIQVLGPDPDLLDKLHFCWVKYADPGLVTSSIIEVDCSIEPDEPSEDSSGDIINSSSAAFIITYNKKRALFLSDTLPSDISKKITTRQPFDVVKISHHGSKYNTSIKLLEKLKCNKFIISTNGPRHYGHPHAETLVRIIRTCASFGYSECNIYFNYSRVVNRIKIKNPPPKMKVNIIHAKVMSL
ncbi:ComEC/Rec2 family competence protein [Aliidiomarina soli]|uniref:MBL fold metallo-hydrolase n=1 Tax=Aliidiomarina soli TaxID=1928574 RepID=A0A432WHT8_9GAMM|nr:MBL fold metallo-hydrolase [Aliidiomarina soli]RUO33323.1 MBL fold metallo-hydrolase [Aliidiomarina soli]